MPLTKCLFAYCCLALGIAALVLPVIPGVPLLILSVKLLGPNHPTTGLFMKLLNRATRSK